MKVSTLERLKQAGKHADAHSTGNLRVRVGVDKTGIEIRALRIVGGVVDRQEATYRLHTDLLSPGQTGRGEIIDAIDRIVDRMRHATVQELVAHLEPGRMPVNNAGLKVA